MMADRAVAQIEAAVAVSGLRKGATTELRIREVTSVRERRAVGSRVTLSRGRREGDGQGEWGSVEPKMIF